MCTTRDKEEMEIKGREKESSEQKEKAQSTISCVKKKKYRKKRREKNMRWESGKGKIKKKCYI